MPASILKQRLARSICFLVLLSGTLCLFPVFAQQHLPVLPPDGSKSVLLLYSAGYYLPAYRKNIASFFSVMEGAGFPVDKLHFEHLDLIRHGSLDHRRQILALLREKYAAQKIDLIITVEGLARDLVLKDGRDFLPETPLLAILSADALESNESTRKVIQIPSVLDMAGTLQLGLSLFPKTKRVFVVVGNGEDEQRWERDAKKQFTPWAGKLEFEYSSELTYEETLRRIGSLPSDAIALYIALYKDKTGRSFVPRDAAIALTRKANAPVFGIYDEITPLLMGGSMISYGAEGARAAKLALEILSGRLQLTQQLVSLPIVTTPTFNWKQMERWGISSRTLPEDSVIINRPPSIWDDYKEYVIGGIALFALQAAMIMALLTMRRHRKRAEERYRQVVENANEAIVIVQDGVIRFYNPRAIKAAGYFPEEYLGAPFTKFIHPLDREVVAERYQKRLAGEDVPSQYDLRIIDKGGQVRWMAVSAVVINWGGRPATLSFLTEVTEQKTAEQNLLESEAKLRAIYDNSRDAIGVSVKGIHVAGNPAYASLFGYVGMEELLGKPIMDLIAPACRDEIAEMVNRIATGQPVPSIYETRGLRKDGTEFDMEATASTYEQFGQVNTLVILRDVTKRNQAEKDLRASEERFRQLYENAPIAYQSLDPDGLILDVNDVWRRILGYENSEVLGRWFGSFLQDNFVPHFENNFPCFKEAGQITGVEFMMRHKDGHSVHVSFNGAIAHDAEGRMIRTHCVFQDITEHRRLEAQLRQAQKMEALGTLSGGIAHDFNNILGAILGFSEIAREDAQAGHINPEDISQIIQAAERAKSLVQQILMFSRKMEPERKHLDLNQEVRRALELLGHTLPKMISTEVRLASDLWRISADSNQLSQVILNLAANAYQAMAEGGNLSISTENVTFNEKLCPVCGETYSGDWVTLTISDTGVGIAPQDMPKIFDPFFTTKEVGQGTGLGLSMVHGIVLSHGGHIECNSQSGEGTTFTVYLPAAQDTAEASPHDADGEADGHPGGHETILLVDDEESLRQLGTRNLVKAGYQVATAGSGEEAVGVFRQRGHQLDLVIMDLGMPGMGGHKALKAILEINPRAKIIVASGYSASGRAKGALEDGAAGYVGKPFNKSELLATVRSVLDKK